MFRSVADVWVFGNHENLGLVWSLLGWKLSTNKQTHCPGPIFRCRQVSFFNIMILCDVWNWIARRNRSFHPLVRVSLPSFLAMPSPPPLHLPPDCVLLPPADNQAAKRAQVALLELAGNSSNSCLLREIALRAVGRGKIKINSLLHRYRTDWCLFFVQFYF